MVTKVISSDQKLERSFLRKLLVMCEFTSKSYTVLFIEQYANTVFMESAIGNLGAHLSLW